MKAVTWHGKRDVRVDDVPDPKIEEPTDAIIKVTSPNICGSDLHLYEVLGRVHDAGRHPRPRADGRSSRRSGAEVSDLEAGRPRRDPVPDLLRALLDVRPGALHPVRDHPGPRAGHGRGAVRLLQALRSGPRRAGGVPARAAGAVHPHQGARRAARRPVRLPLRRAADGLAGGGSTPTCPTAAPLVVLGLGPDRRHGRRIAQHRGHRAVIGVDLVPERLARARRAASTSIDLREHGTTSATRSAT